MTRHDDSARTVRLLPWSTPEGKPSYLIGDGTGFSHVSRVADNIESVQLDMADELEVCGLPMVIATRPSRAAPTPTPQARRRSC